MTQMYPNEYHINYDLQCQHEITDSLSLTHWVNNNLNHTERMLLASYTDNTELFEDVHRLKTLSSVEMNKLLRKPKILSFYLKYSSTDLGEYKNHTSNLLMQSEDEESDTGIILNTWFKLKNKSVNYLSKEIRIIHNTKIYNKNQLRLTYKIDTLRTLLKPEDKCNTYLCDFNDGKLYLHKIPIRAFLTKHKFKFLEIRNPQTEVRISIIKDSIMELS